MSTTTVSAPARRGHTIVASRPLGRWRTIDLIVVGTLGVAFGVAYWAWGMAYVVPSTALQTVFPPLAGITSAPWLMAGVVGGLVVRRPGAALLTELIAAVVSALVGTQWGATVLVSGTLQGLGAEVGFAVFRYAAFGLGVAVLAGALAAPMEAVYEWGSWFGDWGMAYKLAYAGIFTVAGAVIAGGLGWLLTRALAAAGVLDALPPGQELRERRARR